MAARNRGFSLIEMVLVVVIALVLGAIAAPALMGAVGKIKLRYAAVDLSGLLQKARMEAVRKNSFYPVLPTTLPAGDNAYFADTNPRNGNYEAGAEPIITVGNPITIHAGTGSGAPQESAFTSSFTFTNNSASTAPTFNARGLPCTYSGSSSTTCPEAPGQGYFLFLSGPQNTWAALAITPSGRVQIWSYDNSGSGTWVQQ
jgi:prepilin-type N-terminal cleavage/methylation domain-containing protein